MDTDTINKIVLEKSNGKYKSFNQIQNTIKHKRNDVATGINMVVMVVIMLISTLIGSIIHLWVGVACFLFLFLLIVNTTPLSKVTNKIYNKCTRKEVEFKNKEFDLSEYKTNLDMMYDYMDTECNTIVIREYSMSIHQLVSLKLAYDKLVQHSYNKEFIIDHYTIQQDNRKD